MSSKVLVGLQFLMIASITVSGTIPDSVMSLMVFAGGSLLGIAAIVYMQLDNLRIFPEPKKDIRLVTNGPYTLLRHPMYTSVLLITLSFIIPSPSFLLVSLWFILLGVLTRKMQIEETMLPHLLPEYAEYQKQTWKIIPYIY